ncbi:hypothetical protein SAMN04487971_1671, partial [Paracoccus chinensis]
TGEDTARLDDDARNGRRLPLDRLGRGCVADRNTKRLRTGVSGRQPVDPLVRQMDHPGPRLARASPVSSSCRSSQTGRQLSLGITGSLQLPARLTTGCALDPCGLAYSLLRPPASTPKVVAARGWTTGLPPQAIITRQGRDWAAGPTIAAPRRLARDETGGAGKAAKEGQVNADRHRHSGFRHRLYARLSRWRRTVSSGVENCDGALFERRQVSAGSDGARLGKPTQRNARHDKKFLLNNYDDECGRG